MKKFIFVIVLLFLLLTPVLKIASQENTDSSSLVVFDTTGFPQWAKDLRRFDIIAFGVFPFSLAFTNFFYDMYRWQNANNFDFSAEGRRYAPWPLKTAGAYEPSSTEFKRALLIAAGVSLAVALTDHIIVRAKRNKERRRLESLSAGAVHIDRRAEAVNEDEEDGEQGAGEPSLQ